MGYFIVYFHAADPRHGVLRSHPVQNVLVAHRNTLLVSTLLIFRGNGCVAPVLFRLHAHISLFLLILLTLFFLQKLSLATVLRSLCMPRKPCCRRTATRRRNSNCSVWARACLKKASGASMMRRYTCVVVILLVLNMSPVTRC